MSSFTVWHDCGGQCDGNPSSVRSQGVHHSMYVLRCYPNSLILILPSNVQSAKFSQPASSPGACRVPPRLLPGSARSKHARQLLRPLSSPSFPQPVDSLRSAPRNFDQSRPPVLEAAQSPLEPRPSVDIYAHGGLHPRRYGRLLRHEDRITSPVCIACVFAAHFIAH